MANEQTLVFTWNAQSESDLAGFLIWVGYSYNGTITYLPVEQRLVVATPSSTGTTIIPANVPTIFTRDGTWHFALSSFDTTGNESAKSNTVSKRIVRTRSQFKVRR